MAVFTADIMPWILQIYQKRRCCAVYDENEVKLLSEILPHVAAQLRGSLGNMRAAVDHLVPEQDGQTGYDELIFLPA